MSKKKDKNKSALHIAKGTVVDSNINKYYKPIKRKRLSVEEYISGILNGNRLILSQAITLVESQNPNHQELAHQIIEQCLPHSGKSFRLGLTGTPGVGKSTFVESFGKRLLKEEKKIAILAIDPTSQVTKGSILGDKTRMQDLSVHPNVFVRPSPAGDSLGGVARATRETIILCEAAGFDFIIIETVGVGQSETAVHSMVDFFLLLLLPNSGDELQGIKRGVMEMADLIAINKADGENIQAAKLAKKQCRNALHLFPAKDSNWIATAETCSALTGDGINTIFERIESYQNQTKINGYLEHHRKQQAKFWLDESIGQSLKNLFYYNSKIQAAYPKIEQQVISGQISPFKAATELLKIFKQL